MEYTIDKSLQREVIKTLQWSEEQYFDYIFQCGVAYLNKYIPQYPQVVKQIIKSKIYWNWWRLHWEQRDKEFLKSIDYAPHPLLDPVEIYQEHNDPRTLAEAIYLSGKVLENSYAEMIGKITAEQQEVAA